MAERGTPQVGAEDMLARVTALRDEVERSRPSLDLPSARTAEDERAALLNQLDDYVIPRLEAIDAPLLAVVGGSTGSGKSTLVNSILRREVSRSGVLRPTTTSPVLIHHSGDAPWFRDGRVLPSLARVTGDPAEPQSGTVRLAPSEELPPGMAILDAPDIDSVVSANRQLAAQLLSAADLWLFVTTAARYADAIPWGLLRQASDRGTAVALVLDRVDRPRRGVDRVEEHHLLALPQLLLRLVAVLRVEERVRLGRDDAERETPRQLGVRGRRLERRDEVGQRIDRIARLQALVHRAPDRHDEVAVLGQAGLELAFARGRLEAALRVRRPLVGLAHVEAHPASLLEEIERDALERRSTPVVELEQHLVVGHVRQRSPLCAQRTPVRVTHTPFPARRGGPTVRP